MNEDWLERWEIGRTGWHEPEGNRNLQEHWTHSGRRVLVPLCGKTPDLLWLEAEGNSVVGVELAEVAVRGFFDDNDLECEAVDGDLPGWRAVDRDITLYCGDFFDFRDGPFDAHYDRGALVALTYFIALAVIFLVLAAQFEGFTSAVVVTLIVPFGVAAAVLALLLTGTSLNIYSQIGLILLIGLMAKNSVLVVEFADQLRDKGMDVREAIERGALRRFRPVTMTMMSTILGALPLILSAGAGAEARYSIGWVVFGGLGLAAAFTLYLTPALYSLLAPFSKARAAEGSRLQDELDHAISMEEASVR